MTSNPKRYPFEIKKEKKKLPKYSMILLLVPLLAMLVWHNGKLMKTEERDKEGARRIEKLSDCEQYSLRAISSGWYPCTHCRQKLFWLNTNEIAKYGHTCDRSGRYTDEALEQMRVYKVIEFEGDVKQVMILEIQKIFSYYALPENLRRPDSLRISRPVLNKIDK